MRKEKQPEGLRFPASASNTAPNPANPACAANPFPLAYSHEARSAQDPADPWSDLAPVTNSQRIILTGLVRSHDYYFQVRAIGSNGPCPWSDLASVMIA